MTELQWLIQILTKQKLSSSLKDMFIERIGEVELSLSKPTIRPAINVQAPSMQRILDTQDAPVIPSMPINQRIVGGEVNTGNGTKGPRKF